jgi:hypothetical protein
MNLEEDEVLLQSLENLSEYFKNKYWFVIIKYLYFKSIFC